ncbi:hypothetical protein [Streptomyces sp. NPDC088360]|uniref:hypothetical protein n=1 Tax=Streptomyces sp. NPDC088360 TaxID=3154515 RepID=UPI00344F6A19
MRAGAGRIATTAGCLVLTGGLYTDVVTIPGLLAGVATAGVGLATNIKILRAPASVKATAMGVYIAPHTGWLAVLVGERLAPGGDTSALVQAGVVALWTGATWYIRPGLVARDVVEEAIAQELDALVDDAEDEEEPAAEIEPAPVYASDAARWWGEEFAVEDGAAPGTVLVEHQQISEQCVALIIGSAQRGMPVPDISKPGLSAHLDLPEDLIAVEPVPGRGAGVKLVVLGERPQAQGEMNASDDEETWAEIAATAMPGVELLEATTYEMRKELT